MRYYVDCEFDGHGGPLLSVGIVSDADDGIHIEIAAEAKDSWVLENVMPLMAKHSAPQSVKVLPGMAGHLIRHYIGEDSAPTIVADSPVDIGRVCQALSTGPDGNWTSTEYPRMLFEVHNVDCYPTDLLGAVQHNAWWDAMALRHKLTQ